MRIVFVTSEFVTEKHFYGGLANYTFRVAKRLASLGHDIQVITQSQIDESAFTYHGIYVHRLKTSPLPSALGCFAPRNGETGTVERIYFNIKIFKKLKEIIRQKPLDIIQFTNVLASSLLAGIFLRTPHVLRISSYRPLWNKLDRRRNDLDHKIHEWLEWLQIHLAKDVYAPSYYMKQILERDMRPKKVTVIRPPAYIETEDWDLATADPLTGKDYLLFFGRLQVRKGFHILAQALPEFFHRNPGAYAVCVGPDNRTPVAPSMREYSRLLCKSYSDRLIFLDQQPHKNLYPIIAGAKVVVLPSLIENLSNAGLETMLLGKPLVATTGTSFEELILDGQTGFLATPGDVLSLATKLSEAWNHPRLEDIGKAAQRKVAEFSPQKTVSELLNYFETILRRDQVR